jgi:copper chaperone
VTTTTTYTVQGMTCGHCVASVTQEVGKVAGVIEVQVDLDSGAVSVTSDRALDRAVVKEAVEEAGYELVS